MPTPPVDKVSGPAPDPRATDPAPDLVLRFRLPAPVSRSFPLLLSRLRDGLGRVNLRLEAGAGGGISEEGTDFGSVVRADGESTLDLALRPVAWATSPEATLRIRTVRGPSDSEVAVELWGWTSVLGAAGGQLDEWFASALLPALVRQLAPGELGEWVMDQQARRPAGAQAISTYRDPTYHWPNFLCLLDRLGLTKDDRLIEVGCGGGAFLRKALESGCSATGVDHSPEMVRLSREQNGPAVDRGRLTVLEGDAGRLPVADATFTKAVCTGAFPFFPDPLGALREIHRALLPGGRVALFMDTAALRGTPAAPEPFASRGRFYDPTTVAELARRAGFTSVEVGEPDLTGYAKAAGLPAEAVSAFGGGGGGMLLLATKPSAP